MRDVLAKAQEECREVKQRVAQLVQEKDAATKSTEEMSKRVENLGSALDKAHGEVAAAEAHAARQVELLQETQRDAAHQATRSQGELRVASERIERLVKTHREKESESHERLAALQRSLEDMRQQAASANQEQGELDTMQAALDDKQAALDDVKKTDRRIITDLKREMARVVRQHRMEKDEQVMIAEKALGRLRQEADRVAQMEDLVQLLRRDLHAKGKEVEMAKMQIGQLSALAAAQSSGGDVSSSGGGGGLLSWITGAVAAPSTPRRTPGSRGMGLPQSTPSRLTLDPSRFTPRPSTKK